MPNPHPRPDQADPLGFLLALLADRYAVATQAIERFVPTTTIAGELRGIMASDGYNTPAPPE